MVTADREERVRFTGQLGCGRLVPLMRKRTRG